MSEEEAPYGVIAVCEAPKEQVGGDHYRRMKIDVFEFAESNGLTFMEATACKYICRHRFKNGLEDLLKAQHTINRLIDYYYPDNESKDQEASSRCGDSDQGSRLGRRI